MKFSGLCYDITNFKLKKIRENFPTKIEIIHGKQSLYPVVTQVTLFSLHFIFAIHVAQDRKNCENNVTHVKTGYKLYGFHASTNNFLIQA